MKRLSLQGNIGNLARSVVFAFNEPYLRNKPTSVGFQVFSRKSDYNSARNYATVTGQSANLTAAQQSLTPELQPVLDRVELSLSAIRCSHSFKRVGLTYSWDKSTITTFSQASANLFQTLAFRSGQIQGANALEGIYTSSVSLSYTYNKVGPSIFRPRFGTDISAALVIAGLWGNVRYFTPVVQYKHFIAMKGLRPNTEGRNVLGFRMQLSYIQGFSGDVAPPFARFYSGGDNELRGFDVRAATPYGFIPVRQNITLTNPDGTPVPIDPGNYTLGNILIPIPIYRPVSVGGDAKFTSNDRVPDSHCRAGPVRLLRRLRHHVRGSPVAITAKRGGCRPAQFASLRLHRLLQWRLPGRAVDPVHQRDQADRGHQLGAAHVSRRGDLGYASHRECAHAPLLRIQHESPA